MEGLVFVALQPKTPGAVSKIHIEVGKITAVEELTTRGVVTGSRVCVTSGQSFEVREKPEEVIEDANRIINRSLNREILR